MVLRKLNFWSRFEKVPKVLVNMAHHQEDAIDFGKIMRWSSLNTCLLSSDVLFLKSRNDHFYQFDSKNVVGILWQFSHDFDLSQHFSRIVRGALNVWNQLYGNFLLGLPVPSCDYFSKSSLPKYSCELVSFSHVLPNSMVFLFHLINKFNLSINITKKSNKTILTMWLKLQINVYFLYIWRN